MIYTTKIPSPAGKITLASDGIHLIGLWFDGQQYFAHTIKEETKEKVLHFVYTYDSIVMIICSLCYTL